MIVDFAKKQTAVDVVSGTVTYSGESEIGAATTENKWSIKKVEVSGTVTTTKYPIGAFSGPTGAAQFSWDQRDKYVYSFVSDATAPTLSTVTIASNNADTTKAKVGDVVTITVIGSKIIRNIVATVAGNPATAVAGVDGLHWTITYTMVTGDTEGVVPFTIDFTDIGVNPGVQVTAVTGGASVTFDKTVLASDTYLTSVNQNAAIIQTATIATEPVKVTVGNADIGGAVIATTVLYATTIDVTGTASATAGNYTGNITVQDEAGNTKVIEIGLIVTEEI